MNHSLNHSVNHSRTNSLGEWKGREEEGKGGPCRALLAEEPVLIATRRAQHEPPAEVSTWSPSELKSEQKLELGRVRGAQNERGLEGIGDVLARGFDVTPQRHDRIRTGERQPIANHVRSAVWFRDRGKCELCGDFPPQGMSWELDHITPWSAGGSDDSTNLRVLCQWHNQQRSNFIDPTERPRRAVTWWCLNCWDDDHVERSYWSQSGIPDLCSIHGYRRVSGKQRCRPTAGYLRHRDLTGSFPDWFHTAESVDAEAELVVAYCAHCNRPGLTDKPL